MVSWVLWFGPFGAETLVKRHKMGPRVLPLSPMGPMGWAFWGRNACEEAQKGAPWGVRSGTLWGVRFLVVVGVVVVG